MPRYKLTIEYDGTGLAGWQRQNNVPSVQGHIESAIYKFCGKKVNLCTAGRTDAGVHALSQVAHFDTDDTYNTNRIIGAINQHIKPENISILSCEEVGSDFHARYSALRRYYVYRIINRKAPLTLERDRAWFVPVNLDMNLMQQAVTHFKGRHDFTSFRDSKCQSKSPIRTLDDVTIVKNNEVIEIYVTAKSFLHHMVRNIVGTLKYVGEGKIPPSEIPNIITKKKRCAAGPTAPAQGLYFIKVDY